MILIHNISSIYLLLESSDSLHNRKIESKKNSVQPISEYQDQDQCRITCHHPTGGFWYEALRQQCNDRLSISVCLPYILSIYVLIGILTTGHGVLNYVEHY